MQPPTVHFRLAPQDKFIQTRVVPAAEGTRSLRRDSTAVRHCVPSRDGKEPSFEGSKLPSVLIVGPRELKPDRDAISRLREYVTHVEYRGSGATLDWDVIPGESSDE